MVLNTIWLIKIKYNNALGIKVEGIPESRKRKGGKDIWGFWNLGIREFGI
jgi:hypothetical protein